ncbi:MAG: ImmA/IrrE family metallo-endopeptidase [Victivallales bacterium]|nr:ImmA/IrrE family metallo-endopeptidase [Victivallales bacterium]
MNHSSKFASGIRVTGRSRVELRDVASLIRKTLRLEKCAKFPVIRFLEYMQRTFEGFDFEIVEKVELPKGIYAYYNPIQDCVVIDERFYALANQGNGFALWTILHECAHRILHRKQMAAFARQDRTPHKPYEDSEWQANTLVAELMMPPEMLHDGMTAEEIVEKFGVSPKAAEVRLETYKK